MTDRDWITNTIGSVLAFALCGFLLLYLVDPYGLFHNSAGRKLPVCLNDRKAKYLLSERYVPANFNGLIIGPSTALNWEPPTLPHLRIYNESVVGANASEEKRIIDRALRNGTFRLAVCILTPKMTGSHGMNEGLETVTRREALSSIHAFVNAALSSLLAFHAGGVRINPPASIQWQITTANGMKPMKEARLPSMPAFRQDYYDIDPIALRDYRSLVLSLQERGAAIVYVVPPLYGPCYEPYRAQFSDYLHRITRDMPAAPIIDFESADFTGMRSDSDNFIDCLHLNAAGAARMTTLLDKMIPDALGPHEP